MYVLGSVRPQQPERTRAHAHFVTPAVSLTLPRSSQAHVSRESCEEVSFVMSHVRPTHVLVELCKVQHCYLEFATQLI